MLFLDAGPSPGVAQRSLETSQRRVALRKLSSEQLRPQRRVLHQTPFSCQAEHEDSRSPTRCGECFPATDDLRRVAPRARGRNDERRGPVARENGERVEARTLAGADR